MDKTWLMSGLMRKENIIYLSLAAVLAALSYRSSYQQRQIEVLEAECTSLRAGNKSLKSTMWDWKQKLLGEADESSPVPLSRLRAFYGEATPPPPPATKGDVGVEKIPQTGRASSTQKLVI